MGETLQYGEMLNVENAENVGREIHSVLVLTIHSIHEYYCVLIID